MNHKRRRPKNRRAGCLLCKPHKANGAKGKDSPSVRRAMQDPLARLAPAVWDFIRPRERGERS